MHRRVDSRSEDFEPRQFRDIDGREVDFVVTEGRVPVPVTGCQWGGLARRPGVGQNGPEMRAKLDCAVVGRAPSQRRALVVQLEGELNHAGVYQAMQGETLRQLPAGRIVLELPEAPVLADLPELPLEDGDHVLNPHRPAMDYVDQAGGPKVEADRKNMFVLRADGSVISNGGGWFTAGRLSGVKVQPGDAIIVPEDLYRTMFTKDLKDWTQIFYQFGLGAAALKVIRD